MTQENTICNKPYRAVFFDWDGTAVLSRKAPVEHVVACMAPLLDAGVQLIIISGTTWENIAQGALNCHFTPAQLKNLYLGLGRGAYNYGFDANGQRITLHDAVPAPAQKLAVDAAAWTVHQALFEQYGICTDIVFSRPNYCKIDLMVESQRGDALYLQEGELAQLKALLTKHGFAGGAKALVSLAEEIAARCGETLFATTDAKYLELGMSTKSHNVDYFMQHVLTPQGIAAAQCCFWGDEYRFIDEGVPGSDAQMMTRLTADGDFFDVSCDTACCAVGEGQKSPHGVLPGGVTALGGQTERFLAFLRGMAEKKTAICR